MNSIKSLFGVAAAAGGSVAAGFSAPIMFLTVPELFVENGYFDPLMAGTFLGGTALFALGQSLNQGLKGHFGKAALAYAGGGLAGAAIFFDMLVQSFDSMMMLGGGSYTPTAAALLTAAAGAVVFTAGYRQNGLNLKDTGKKALEAMHEGSGKALKALDKKDDQGPGPST